VRWVTWRAISARPYSAVGIPEEIDSVRTAADADEGYALYEDGDELHEAGPGE